MSQENLIMSELPFVDGTAHLDTLNAKCLDLFDNDDMLMMITVYRHRDDVAEKKLLGRIYRPGHSEYFRDCGEITWKYLRKLNEYDVANEPDGDGVRIP